MFYLLPMLATLPFALAFDHELTPPSGFSRIVRPRVMHERRGVESMVTDLLGGASQVGSEQTAPLGLTFPTTALATPSSSSTRARSESSRPILSDRPSSVSSSVDSSSSSSVVSVPSSVSSTAALSTSPAPSPSESAVSSSSLRPSSVSTLASSETAAAAASSISTSTVPPRSTTPSVAISTEQALSTAQAVTILSTLGGGGGGGEGEGEGGNVKTIYSTAGGGGTAAAAATTAGGPDSTSTSTNSPNSIPLNSAKDSVRIRFVGGGGPTLFMSFAFISLSSLALLS